MHLDNLVLAKHSRQAAVWKHKFIETAEYCKSVLRVGVVPDRHIPYSSHKLYVFSVLKVWQDPESTVLHWNPGETTQMNSNKNTGHCFHAYYTVGTAFTKIMISRMVPATPAPLCVCRLSQVPIMNQVSYFSMGLHPYINLNLKHTLPEALLGNIWQQPHRLLDVFPSPSRILLFCTALCSFPRSAAGPFHSLLMLDHIVPAEIKRSLS